MVRKKSKKLEKEIASPLKISIIWSKLVNPKFQMWVCLITLSSVISLLLFPNILSTRKEDFSLGDIVNRDIKSSQDFLVEDEELTKQRRDEAEKSSLFIYDFDRSGTYTKNRIRESFMYGRSGLEELLSIDLEPTLREEKFGELR
ncbi:MAG TPA: hypothetical protein VMW42_12715, partial [Desulfatiglandales bacterium]|nr:hypothetical protein [Desulfatiglandales bacterium]